MKILEKSNIDIASVIPYDSGSPKINGPSVYGASPLKPFSYAIPTRGQRPLKFYFEGVLPQGLKLDSSTGFFSGIPKDEGEYKILLRAENEYGSHEKEFRIIIAENNICLTPLLGMTSWNAHMEFLNQEIMLANAKILVSSGLAARGYNYINIDSCWQGKRDKKTLALQPNKRFPNIRRFVAEIHALGLKAGIYSTPMVIAWGSTKFELFPGSTGYPLDPAFSQPYFGGCGAISFEEVDAAQWAEWGFDYLKYDWPECDVEHVKRMSKALRKTNRDLVFSLTTNCKISEINSYRQYANMFRSNADTADRWESISANGFSADNWAKYVKPGSWFDMDMLALGNMMIERNGENPHYHPNLTSSKENRLSRDEQITHMTIWALFPSPIQISCDLTSLDDFTLALLSNEEILAINQDEEANAAICVRHDIQRDANGNKLREIKIYRRQLAGGKKVFGFFNLSDSEQQVDFQFEKPLLLRDPWALRDVEGKMDKLNLLLPPHGSRILISRGK